MCVSVCLCVRYKQNNSALKKSLYQMMIPGSSMVSVPLLHYH